MRMIFSLLLVALIASPVAAAESESFADELRAAVETYQPSSAESARRSAAAAFFLFEASPLDRELAARDPRLYRAIEDEWLRLLSDMGQGASSESIRERAERVLALLERGARSRAAEGSVFLDSLLVILREGFEAILIVSALAAYLVRVGERAQVPYLFGGAGMAVVASFSLWLAARTMIELSGVEREALEGGTQLAAASVLFWVSYWLVSKAQAERWQAFVKRRAEAALGRGALLGFGVLAFAVVFREGFETVLFYEAISAGAGGPSGQSALAAGFLTGCGLLVVAYISFLRLGKKIPLAAFFNVTGGLLYFMAFKFAGAGIYELQAASVLSQTPLGFFPDSDVLRQWFGVYPYAESLALQAVLVLLALLAIAVVRSSRLPAAATEPVVTKRAVGDGR